MGEIAAESSRFSTQMKKWVFGVEGEEVARIHTENGQDNDDEEVGLLLLVFENDQPPQHTGNSKVGA